jgi:hypothetical protein
MSIAIKSLTTGTNTGTTATVSVTTSESPSATASGDLVIVFYSNDFYALSNMPTPLTSVTGSPTVTEVTSGTVPVDAGSNEAHMRVFWYVANTAGAQTITATETGTHDEEKELTAVVLSGANTSTPIDGSAAGAFSTVAPATFDAPAVSPSSSDAFLIIHGVTISNSTYTTPAPLTEQAEFNVSNLLTGVTATEQLSASGSTGAFTFTPSTAARYAVTTVAIATAATDATVILGPSHADVTIHP